MQYDPDDDSGFFGEVSSSEFITSAQLSSTLNVTQGQVQETDWLKFYLDGKVLFFPKRAVRYQISRKWLLDNNLVFGERTTVFRGLTYKVRLIKTLSPGAVFTSDPNLQVNNDAYFSHDSEWNRLMYRVAGPCPTDIRDSQKGPNWIKLPQTFTVQGIDTYSDKYTDAPINWPNGSVIWSQDMSTYNTAQNIYVGLRGVTWLGVATQTSTGPIYGWRPVLELIQ